MTDFNDWGQQAVNPSSFDKNFIKTIDHPITDMTTYNTVAETKINENFLKNVKALRTRLHTNSTYNIWISFIAGDLNISTGNKNTNFFAALDYTRHGTGKANIFNLTLYYTPNFDRSKENLGNPNWIDSKLFNHTKRTCSLQYGYDTGNGILLSPKYTGIILDWTVELRAQMLIYSIKGITSIAKYMEETQSFDSIPSTTCTGTVYNAFKTYIKSKQTKDSALAGWQVKYISGTENSDKIVDIPAVSEASIFDYASQILSLAEDKNQTLTGDDYKDYTKKIRYEFYFDDSSKTIYIARIDPSVASTDIVLPFRWFDKTNSILLDFKPDISGAVFMALNTRNSDEDSKFNYSFDENGDVVVISSNNETFDASLVVKDDLKEGIFNWAKATQYAYKATATMIGIPCLIPMLSKIKIVPIINGVEHHSSGTYMIVEVSDQLDNSGYKTMLKLVKCQPKYLSDEITANVVKPTTNIINPNVNQEIVTNHHNTLVNKGTLFYDTPLVVIDPNKKTNTTPPERTLVNKLPYINF